MNDRKENIEKKKTLKKEWDLVKKKEESFISERKEKKESALNRLLADKVPEKLQSTLDVAFSKAFSAIFHKGTSLIEKTYRKEQMKENFIINSYAVDVKKGTRGLRTFSRDAGKAGAKNLAISGVEGIGLGLLGIGIPDIPIFVAVVLKNMYELALSYGYTYESEEERYWILLLIRGAFIYGDNLEKLNRETDRYIKEETLPEGYDSAEEIRKTSAELSKELLYMKFLQGIPVAGAAGGAYDIIYLRKIQRYSGIKYRKRFLYDQARSMAKEAAENEEKERQEKDADKGDGELKNMEQSDRGEE